MKISPDFFEIDSVLRKFGLSPVPFDLRGQQRLPPPGKRPFFEEEVNPDDLTIGEDGTFVLPDGTTVFLYIDRFSTDSATVEEAIANPTELRKFHLSECYVLRNMRAANRFERYVATDRDDGPFNITLTPKGQHALRAAANLHVCQPCLAAIDWNGFRKKGLHEKKRAVETFSRTEFLKKYSPSFASRPSRSASTTTIVDYPSDWREISQTFRASRGYRCEAQNCGVDCSSRPSLTDAHHVNHDVTDCRPENLQVLCKLCHEQRHRGWYRVRDRERREILQLRKSQEIAL